MDDAYPMRLLVPVDHVADGYGDIAGLRDRAGRPGWGMFHVDGKQCRVYEDGESMACEELAFSEDEGPLEDECWYDLPPFMASHDGMIGRIIEAWARHWIDRNYMKLQEGRPLGVEMAYTPGARDRFDLVCRIKEVARGEADA